jgi:hypothetical protein
MVAAALVHLMHWYLYRGHKQEKMPRHHYVWVTDQRQTNIEWHLRSLFSFSRMVGKDVQLTVIDNGLSDEALAIVNRFAREQEKIKVHAAQDLDKHKEGSSKEKTVASNRNADQWLWLLQNEGVVSASDSAVLIDLHNPEDLSKLPY